MGRNGILKCFYYASLGADIAIIEGVMGLFDGFSGKDDFESTAHIAKILDAQILLRNLMQERQPTLILDDSSWFSTF